MNEALKEDKKYYIPCQCGCGIMEFLRDKDEIQDTLYVSYYPLGFYAYQHPLRKKIKAIWDLIRGKEYRLYDIVVDYERFRYTINKMEKDTDEGSHKE